ncbi:hypothetical protein AB0L49_37415 [Streptomyces antimycoticus]|uniref:hypothetical protein n=1 Tax=Streptomyces antimycoticus TaxID=68175 RepID=UPI0034231A0C
MHHYRSALGLAVIDFGNVGFLLQTSQLGEFADGDQGRRRSAAVSLITMVSWSWRGPVDQLVELVTGLGEAIYLLHTQNVHMGE